MRLLIFCLALTAASAGELEKARDRQDRAALEKLAASAQGSDAQSNYRAALAYSYLAEVAEEQHDRAAVKGAAEAGIRAAEKAVQLAPQIAEHHRVLGTLYGQMAPVNVLAALGYGKKAQEAIARTLELDPKSARAYVARGVGNYYIPSGFGGGIDLAIRDFQKAIELDPKSDDAFLWLGLAHRKAGHNADARKAFAKALELNPGRVWAKQQLDKTPAN
jgi:tetratricopeptide (TPR) repeat protein